jgi:PAS domain-containing protein
MGYAEGPRMDAAALRPPVALAQPPKRANLQELSEAAEACLANPVVRFLLDSLDAYVLVLDEHRQILSINGALRAALGLRPSEPILGKRPGELLGCQHVPEGVDGCGTAPACAYCGLVMAFLKTQATGKSIKTECLLTLRRNGQFEAAEYEVTGSPLQVGPHPFIVVILHDISAAKRREVLERLFHHDVANLVQGIQGWVEILSEGGGSSALISSKLTHLTDLLARELNSHKAMSLAEQGELKPAFKRVHPILVLEEVVDLMNRHPSAEGRHLKVQCPKEDLLITTDPELLNRVLSNMVVNALEASTPGETVTLAAQHNRNTIRFLVHNAGEIPPAHRSRIFQRSFSTKGVPGRGLGTYAMKLFGEDVLGGRVAFDTGSQGTTFYIDLPLK